MKINKEMPWFFQKVTGLELVETYGEMKEPFRGSEKPKIEISCLEENVELTAIGLMSLYKEAVYDYERYIEILPKNLRHFRVWIVLSEVRTFQQDTGARDLNLYGAPMPGDNASKSVNIIPRAKGSETAIGKNSNKFDIELATAYGADSKPHMMFELGFCEWQADSIADMFADASKNPEKKNPKLSFTWNTGRINTANFGPNITIDSEGLIPSPAKPVHELYPNTPFNPLANAQNAISDKINGIAGSLVNRFNNLKNALPGQGNSPLGAVYPERLTGPAASFANAGLDKLKGLLLDNVHGLSGALDTLSSVNTALEAGSINGIANLAGQLFKKKETKSKKGDISPQTIYEPGVDSSPDDNINERVYDPRSQEAQDQTITPGRIYDQGVDSSPDGNLNDNVHE